MESVDGGFARANATPSQPFSIPLSMEHPSTAADESDEWEYEYSATETEIYYLTLDLTTPSTPSPRPKIPRSGRGGYKTAWINPGLGRHKRQLGSAPTITLSKADSRGSAPTSAALRNDEDVVEDEGNDDVEIQEQDGAYKASKTGGSQEPETSKEPEKIQILDLHSENPVIAYRGHSFSCSWAENIGTELLFTTHDPAKPLPVLRSLPDDVDLLAAVSARLISASATLVPKTHDDIAANVTKPGYKPRKSIDTKSGEQIIPVGKDASISRKEQARFLERMMEIKQQKGEKDAVTIIAQRRLYPAGWRSLVKEKREEERAQLLLVAERDGMNAFEAMKRLEEMNREDIEKAERERLMKDSELGTKKRKSVRRRKVAGQGPAKPVRGASIQRRPRGGRDMVKLSEVYSAASTPTSRPVGEEQSMLSTPTPQTWGHLESNDAYGRPDNEHMADE